MTNDQIRLHFGELNAAEMRLARAIVGWHEAREAKLRSAADGLAEACTKAKKGSMNGRDTLHFDAEAAQALHSALAAYQATKP